MSAMAQSTTSTETPANQAIGFIVNPIAGMGGPVALKGTDNVADEARNRGADPVSPERAERFLRTLEFNGTVLTCSGPMGAQACSQAGVPADTVLEVPESTTAEHTKQAARLMADAGVQLLVFVGGDGTAVDLADTIGHEVPCLGVPGGVKMNSAVFARTPEHAARVVTDVVAGRVAVGPVEIVEIDEDRLREGSVREERLGSLLAPEHEGVQASKAAPGGGLESIAEAGETLATLGSVLVLGPGSTVFAIKERLVGDGSLLGVDVVETTDQGEHRLVVQDATADQLREVPGDARVVVSPIGGQGFVLGRGNQQLVPDLIGRIGFDRLIVVATPEKLAGLDALWMDTGDPALDAVAPAHVDVVTGPGFRTRTRVQAGPELETRKE